MTFQQQFERDSFVIIGCTQQPETQQPKIGDIVIINSADAAAPNAAVKIIGKSSFEDWLALAVERGHAVVGCSHHKNDSFWKVVAE